MAGRPLIGVTGPADLIAAGRLAACAAIRRAGGRAVRLRPGDGHPPELDAVVVTGGSDINPELSGHEGPWVEPDPQRDEFELVVLRQADHRRWPVLGICRGAQLMNVHRDGTLHGDISTMRRHTSNRRWLLPSKHVRVDPDSLLARVTGRRALKVNSLHHQAVDRPGRDLKVVARDRDGIVQAIEGDQGERFYLGVQWHPEYLACMAAQFRLFQGLVRAAR